jgi:hypothetical protein
MRRRSLFSEAGPVDTRMRGGTFEAALALIKTSSLATVAPSSSAGQRPVNFHDTSTSTMMPLEETPDYSTVVSATGFLRPRASRSLSTFHDHLLTSNCMLALLGAGLSAPSGIPTYRGAGGLWYTYEVTQLATPAGCENDPALVGTCESERRRMIVNSAPSAAHAHSQGLRSASQASWLLR